MGLAAAGAGALVAVGGALHARRNGLRLFVGYRLTDVLTLALVGTCIGWGAILSLAAIPRYGSAASMLVILLIPIVSLFVDVVDQRVAPGDLGLVRLVGIAVVVAAGLSLI